MKPGWVAASVRARLLATRRRSITARSVADAGSVHAAVVALAASPYGHDVGDGMSLGEAVQGVRATALWHLRVLAGWLPPGTSERVRVVAGWFEILDVEAQLDRVEGLPPSRRLELGALATAPRIRTADSVGAVRGALARSSWGDPGTGERAELLAALRLAWARRLAEQAPEVRSWAAAHAAVVVAGERFASDRLLSRPAAACGRRLLGPVFDATDLGAFASGLPVESRWALAAVDGPRSIWRGEWSWWRRVQDEAVRRVARASRGETVVIWAALLLLADAQRVAAALEAAAWGRAGLGAFDALG